MISDRLKDYPTTFWEDKKLLDKAEGIMRDVIVLRMGEKEVYQYYLNMARSMVKYLGSNNKRTELAPYEVYLASLEEQRANL